MTVKYWILFFCLLVVTSPRWGYALQVPENCLTTKVKPCLIKLAPEQRLVWEKLDILPSQEALFRIINFDSPAIEVTVGRIKIYNGSHQHTLLIDGYALAPLERAYVNKSRDEFKILNTERFELMTIRFETHKDTSGYVLQKSDFVDKKTFVQFILPFYYSRGEFKGDLDELSVKYKALLESDAKKQTALLQKQIDRKIATEMEAKERQRLVKERIEADRAKTRQQYFQRTFLR
jgi:hypothetical protein